jgi:hypothetical protein
MSLHLLEKPREHIDAIGLSFASTVLDNIDFGVVEILEEMIVIQNLHLWQ